MRSGTPRPSGGMARALQSIAIGVVFPGAVRKAADLMGNNKGEGAVR